MLRRALRAHHGVSYRAEPPYLPVASGRCLARVGALNKALATLNGALVIAGETDEGYWT